MRFTFVKTVALSAALALSSGVANSAIITATYGVTGSNFLSTGAPPYSSITESFTITFDNTQAVSQQTAGITLNASTITPASPLAFTYIPVLDTLTVGGTAATVTASDPVSTDFALTIGKASNTAAFSITALSYSVGSGVIYTAQTTGPAAAASVPEPVSLTLLGSAIAAFGFTRRRRKIGG